VTKILTLNLKNNRQQIFCNPVCNKRINIVELASENIFNIFHIEGQLLMLEWFIDKDFFWFCRCMTKTNLDNS